MPNLCGQSRERNLTLRLGLGQALLRRRRGVVDDHIPVIGRQHAYRQQARRRGGLVHRDRRVAPSAPAADAAERVQPVPLGGSLDGQTGDRSLRRLCPDPVRRRADDQDDRRARSTTITGPDGRPRQNGQEVGDNQQGWYTFQVSGDRGKPYTVETTFVQVGAESTRKPWNFYYWPTKADSIHEPWAGGNGRVDTMRPVGDDQSDRPAGRLHRARAGHRPGRPQRPARDPPRRRRRRHLVPQPVRRPDLAGPRQDTASTSRPRPRC